MLKYKYCNKLEVKIDVLGPNDIPEVAQLYEDAFSNHFLGHMGQKFLGLFCSHFVNSPTNYGYVAKYKGKPVGFLLASTDSAPFHQFYRRNFLVLALIVFKRYLMDSYVRKNIAKRLGNILVAIKTLLPFSKTGSITNQGNTFKPARLLAIGVGSKYRGIGIADKLTSHFCEEMKSKGLKKVGLSVLPWNERAINFYNKDGWIEEERSETSLSFTRDL